MNLFMQPQMLTLSIPIRPRLTAVMSLPRPMTSGDWDQMMTVLEAMKPGIVRDPPEPPLDVTGKGQP